MIKKSKKYLLMITIVVIFIFSWFWTEGFGISPKYQYGKTIEQALNYWHERGQSNVGLVKIASTVDISENKKLVFYETTNHTLAAGLVEKKWNHKWIVVEQGGDVPLDNASEQGNNSKSDSLIRWRWHNLKDFGITYGVIYDPNIESVTVGTRSATLSNQYMYRYFWCNTDKDGFANGDLQPTADVKAYGKSGNIIYSYYPQQ